MADDADPVLVYVTDSQELVRWNVKSNVATILAQPSLDGAYISISPTGQRAILVDGMLPYRLVDVATGTIMPSPVVGQTGYVRWSPDGNQVTFRSPLPPPRMGAVFNDWDIRTNRVTLVSDIHETDASWSHDSRYLTLFDRPDERQPGGTYVWDSQTQQLTNSLGTGPSTGSTLAPGSNFITWSPHADELFLISPDATTHNEYAVWVAGTSSAVPPSSSTVSLTVTPSTRQVGDHVVLLATVRDAATNAPKSGQSVTFQVLSGPDQKFFAAVVPTDSNGQAATTLLGHAKGLDTVAAWLDSNVNGVIDTGEPHATVQVAWTAPRYVALGDSYASGEGASAFDPATDIPNVDMCHRVADTPGTSGWAYAVAKATAYDLDFAACSGALIEDLYGPNQYNGNDFPVSPANEEGLQLARLSGEAPKLVTLSIGGNNMGFGNVLNDCIGGLEARTGAGRNGGCAARDTRAVQQAFDWLQHGRPDSTTKKGGCNVLPGTAPGGIYQNKPEPVCGAAPSLHQVYEDILSQLAPGGTLVVVGYPKLFGQPRSGSCAVAQEASGFVRQTISAGDVAWINRETDQLNTVIKHEVATASLSAPLGEKIVFAPTDAYFDHHRICDTSTPWIHAVVLSGFTPTHLSFHPTDEGQKAQSTAVVAALPK